MPILTPGTLHCVAAAQRSFQPQGVPTYGGYAVGSHVVQAFLRRSGLSIEAATFLPAREIVAESGVFSGSQA